VKRQLLILAGFALFFCGIVGLKNRLASTSAQSPTAEVLVAQLQVPNNSNVIRIRGVSNDGKRVVFETPFNYNGTNGDGNNEIWFKDVDSQTIVQITNTADFTDASGNIVNVDNFTPVISGNGNRIAFASNAPSLDPASPNNTGNFEIYLYDFATSPATFTRITNTGLESGSEIVRGITTNLNPSISDDGNVIAFETNRQIFNPIGVFTGITTNNADRNFELMVADMRSGSGQYVPVTDSRLIDRPPTFFIEGYNQHPRISGNGEALIFNSDYNYDSNKNSDWNGELYYFRLADRSILQITQTTSSRDTFNAVVPIYNPLNDTFSLSISAPTNIQEPYSKPINFDGTRVVIESAGNLTGSNPNKARQLWICTINPVARTVDTTQITNQPVSAIPTQDELRRIDHTFMPSINSAGTSITFNSTLNFVPTSPSDVNTDNGDGSSEVFSYDTTTGIFRQLTFTTPSPNFLDQRLNKTSSFMSDVSPIGDTIVSFNYVTQSILPNSTNVIDLYQAIVRPITNANVPGTAIGNAANFDTNQIARGSLAFTLGTQIAAADPAAGQLPYILNGVSVRVGRVAARISSISGGQVTIVLPNGLSTGVLGFSINDNGVQYTGNTVIVDASPGIFLDLNRATDCYQAAINNYSEAPCPTNNTLLIIYGTGWRNAPSSTQVKIGSMTLTPVFSGSGSAVYDQINVAIPAEVAGMTLDVSVLIAGTTVESNKVSVPFQGAPTALTIIPNGTVCYEPATGGYYDTPCATNNSAILVIYGMGWRNAASTQVNFGGTIVNSIWSGAASASLDQVNVSIPPGLTGATVDVSVLITGTNVESNRVSVPFQGAPTALTILDNGLVCFEQGTGRYYNTPCAANNSAILIIYGTGWRNAASLQVRYGDIVVNPLWSGRGSATIDQVNVPIPTQVAGSTVNVSVIIPNTAIESNRVGVPFQ
jgi:uncharacterized protein (TIGR03437 family)